ncbi:unnamed protein product [Effrenium voratum]|nr:unnamed protein product [Effrenium voratum]
MAEDPKDSKKDEAGYEQLSKLGVPASLGERMLLQAPKPQVEAELPAALRAEERIEYDKARYDFRAKLTSLLGWAGPHIGFGSFREGDTELEMFQAKEEVFSSFKYEKRWRHLGCTCLGRNCSLQFHRLRQCILGSSDFLACYELLLKEVICPILKSKLPEDGASSFYCQFPPTVRLQPGPSERPRRLHRDAEFGHQDGEVNFWMPLTDYSSTKTTLWVESQPNAEDFHPLELEVGQVAMFHGTLVRHYAPCNPTEHLRVSMDFRVGVGRYFDPSWRLEGLQHYHGRRVLVL